MRYNTIVFDWGDTLSIIDSKNVPVFCDWVQPMIKKLYASCYRLAIISNTHRYQDAHWIRTELAKRSILQEFEAIISSATYAIHKPHPKIFEKLIDFMQIDPLRSVMVGDSEHCDGAAQFFGMTYMPVKRKEQWDQRLFTLLNDSFPKDRKLCNLYEYGVNGDTIYTKLRHLSTAVEVGDRILVGGIERRITALNKPVTKEMVLHGGEEFVEIGLGLPTEA